MTTTVQLTPASLTALSAAFGSYPAYYNGLVSAAQTSQYLAGMINAFVSKGGNFVVPSGKAADTSPDGQTIYVGSSLFQSTNTDGGVTTTTGESPLVIATLLGHELGHALLPGGEGDVNGPSTNPDEAAANGLANEGVAVTSEYIVATQLGLNGQGIIPQTMHSDPDDVLTPQLNQIAQSEGVNVGQLTYGSAGTTAFVQPNTSATNAAAAFYAQGHPSVAPSLTYQQYYADAWIVNNCGGIPASSVDWSQVQQSMFTTTLNSNGTCTINTSAIPLLTSAGGGTAPAIDGTLSAPAVNEDGTQTSTFTDSNGEAVSTLLFGLDGGIATSIYDPTTGALIGVNTTSANGAQLVDTTLTAGRGSITSVTEQDGSVFVDASGANIAVAQYETATIDGSSNVFSVGTDTSLSVNNPNGTGSPTVITSDSLGNVTIQFDGDSVVMGPLGDEISQTSSGALNVAVGPSGTAQVSLSEGDTTGSPIAFSGVESMMLNLDGSYAIVDQSGNAYTLQSVNGSSNYLLSNSSGTLDVTLDASSLTGINLGQSVSLQTVAGGTVTVPVFGGSGSLGLGNLGDATLDQGSSVTIGANTIDVSSPGSGTTQQYSFASDGTVSSIATYDGSSSQTFPATVSTYNSDGVQTQFLTNSEDGTSQIVSWNAADPSAAYIDQTQNFSGSNGTGSLINETTDFTDGLSEIDVYNPAAGTVVTKTVYSDLDGTGDVLSQTTNFSNGTSSVTTYAAADAGDDSGLSLNGVTAITTTYSGWDGTGSIQSVVDNTASSGSVSASQIGSALGSTIGRLLGGNSAVESIGLSSVLGTLGQEVGNAIDLENASGGSGDISGIVQQLASSAVPDVAEDGASAVGSYLTGELVKDLGISGLPAQVVDTGAGYVVSTIATNLTEEALGTANVAWDSGLSVTNFAGSFAGFAGVEIATLTMTWASPEQTEIADVGADIGSAIGSAWGPWGAFAGAFIGDLLGGIIGAAFGDSADPTAYGTLRINPDYSSPVSYAFTSVQNKGPVAYLSDAGTLISTTLNAIVSEEGGVISNAQQLNNKLDMLVDVNSNSIGFEDQYVSSGAQVVGAFFNTSDTMQFVTAATFEELADMTFSGGDAYVEKAIEATTGEWITEADDNGLGGSTYGGTVAPSQPLSITLDTLAGNIQIAKDYETYLANEGTINDLIAQNPTSDFAAGWIIELQQAASLGLNDTSSNPLSSTVYYDGIGLSGLHSSQIENIINNPSSVFFQTVQGYGLRDTGNQVTLDVPGTPLTLQRDNLDMQVNGDYDRISNSGSNNSIVMNGTSDVFSDSGNGNTITENGDSATLEMYGNNNSMTVNGQYASIQISGLGNSLTNANGNVTIAANSSVVVNGVAENLSLWSGSLVLINGGNMIVSAGDDNNITANGNYEQVVLTGDGNSVTGNGQGDLVNVDGTNETVTLGSGSVSLADGVAVAVNGESLGIDIGNQDQLTLGGQNAGVTVNGDGDTVTLNGTSLGISGATDASSLTMNGSGDSISISGSNNSLTGNGSSDYLTVSGNNNNLVANGQQFTATLSGAGNTATVANGSVVLQNSSTATVNGVSDSVSIYNTTQLVVNGGSMNFSANGGEDTITLNGDDEGVSVQGASNVLTDNGKDNTVTVNGNSNDITENGSGEWVTVNGSYDAVQGQMDSTTVTINGTGGAITATGNNNLLFENGTNDYLTVTGNNNGLTANGQQITASLTGTGNTVSIGNGTVSLSDNAGATIDGVSDQVNVRDTSQLVVNGGSMSFAVNGSQNTITANGNGNSFSDEASSNLITGNGSDDSFSANGSYNDVTLNGNDETSYINGTDNVLAVNGQGNQVTFAGTNNTLHASGAVAFVLDNSSADFEGGGDNLTVYNGDTVTVNGSGFSISETATNTTVVANGDYNVSTIGGNNNAITLNGNSGQVEMSGSLNSVTVSGQSAILSVSGVQQSLAVNQGNITVAAGSQASLTGNGNMVALGASDTWTENGSNNWVNAASDDTVTMMGDGNGVGGDATGVTAILEGNGQYAILSDDAITVGAGVQVSVTGNSDTVTAGVGATLDVTGNGNSLQMTGGTLVLPDSESTTGSDPETGNSESGFAINGFDYSSYNAGEFSSAAGAQSMQSLAATGANSVSLVVTQYVQNVSDINIEPTSATESDASVEQAIAEAQAQGISVTLDPHLDIADGTWRAYLDPSNVAQFFANYQAMIVHYAEIAQATGVGMLVIGTEMESLSGSAYESYWDNLIAAVRQVYSGKLTYASGWDETANVSFWNKLDVIGADAYVPVTSETDPTLQQLEAGWTTVSSNSYAASVMDNMSPLAFYESMSAEYDKPLLFTEIGYQSVNDTNQLEGAFGTSNWVDFQQQSQALQAFFTIFSQNGGNWFDGAYLWNWEANPAGVEANDFSPQGKAALNIVDYWYGLESGSQSGASTPNTLTGNSNTVTVGNGDALNIVGDDNNVTLGANGAVNVDGQGNTVQVTGGNNLIQTSDATTITLTGTGTTAMVVGDGNNIIASGPQDGLAVNGNSSAITLSGDTDALTVSGDDSTINVQGNGDTVSVTGTGNVVDVTGSGAVIQTSGATTVEIGSTADSTSVAGDGDTIQINGTANTVSVSGSGASIVVGDGGATLTLDGGSYQVSAGNGNNAITAGDGSDVVSVGSGTNTIVLGNGADTVTLGNGTDTLTLGSGADSVTLGNGSASIALGGDDTIAVNVAAGDSTNAASALITDASTASGQSNQLTFGSADSDQLWFSRSNNDLLVSVIGTSSEIDISNWYSNSSAMESITAANGKVLTGDDVNALVNAMAAFSPPAAGSTTLPESYQSQLEPVIAANWH